MTAEMMTERDRKIGKVAASMLQTVAWLCEKYDLVYSDDYCKSLAKFAMRMENIILNIDHSLNRGS